MIRGVRTRPRLDPDARGGLRLTLAAVGGLVLAVPFGLLLLLVADRWGPLTRLDQRVAEALHAPALAHPSYVQVLRAISLVLSPSVFQAVGVVVAVVLILRWQPRLAAWLVVTVLGSGLLDTAVLAAYTGSSRLLRGVTLVLALVLPPLVGFCRMYRGFHHLSDIVVGALLGGSWLLVTTRLLLTSRHDRP